MHAHHPVVQCAKGSALYWIHIQFVSPCVGGSIVHFILYNVQGAFI